MKHFKPRLYIIAFSLFYLLLIGLFIFYSVQVWDLKQKEVYSLAQEKIELIEDHLAIDDKNYNTDIQVYNAVLDLLKGKYSIEEMKEIHQDFLSKINLDVTQKVDSVFSDLGYEVAFRLDVTDVLLDETQESILAEPITLLHTANKLKSLYRINNSEWEVEDKCKDCPEDLSVHFTIKQAKYIEVLNYKSIVFKELIPLYVGTSLICLCILVLYFITYKTIRKKEQEVIMLHNMVDNVSHEFKLPIATLKYACTILIKENRSPTVALIQRQVNRLERLQNTLTSNSVEIGGQFTKEDFTHLMNDLSTNFKEVVIDYEWLVTDILKPSKTSIETILINLIENGVKYGGTHIICKVSDTKNMLQITVQDNGIGIKPEETNLIFEKFYRIIHNNIHLTKGLGLGLYQIKEIVDYYKGSIHVNSQINKGSTFTILIPHV